MSIKDFITTDYKALDLHDLITDVKVFFKDLPFTHFPVVENDVFIGMLAQSDIKHLTNSGIKIVDIKHLLLFYKTDIPDSCIDLISLFAQHDTDILPIIDKENNYIGYFELNDIIHLFNNAPFFKPNSTTLIIEKEESSYSMGEIAQIVEANNISLLGMYISNQRDIKTQITLRVDTENANEVIQSLRRYDYHVITQNKDDLHLEELKNRSDYLHKYLSI
ncbi:MAG TPA: CBS domain-containing protein [Lutibacter sp.]|nr:CBS domain-containing protein [Lutibacter sp.]